MSKKSLHQAKKIGRFLISSPAKFVGELEIPGLLISHAFPNILSTTETRNYLSPSPYSQYFYILSTSITDTGTENQPASIPKYNLVMVADLVSLWYGKQIFLHGWIQSFGQSWMPYGIETRPKRMPFLGISNSIPRKDLQIQLNFDELKKPIQILVRKHSKTIDLFLRSASSYAKALRAFEYDPEVAFVELVSTLEILSSGIDFPEDELFDEITRADLQLIKHYVPNGTSVTKRIKSRMRQLRKRVALTAVELVNDAFFAGSESAYPQFALTRDKLESSMTEAYDVRSLYHHEAYEFSPYTEPHGRLLNETVVVESSSMPTFLGLERLVRFIILRFANTRILPIHDYLS